MAWRSTRRFRTNAPYNLISTQEQTGFVSGSTKGSSTMSSSTEMRNRQKDIWSRGASFVAVASSLAFPKMPEYGALSPASMRSAAITSRSSSPAHDDAMGLTVNLCGNQPVRRVRLIILH